MYETYLLAVAIIFLSTAILVFGLSWIDRRYVKKSLKELNKHWEFLYMAEHVNRKEYIDVIKSMALVHNKYDLLYEALLVLQKAVDDHDRDRHDNDDWGLWGGDPEDRKF